MDQKSVRNRGQAGAAITREAALEGLVLICNICDATEFLPGPAGRLSRTGLPPVCAKCRSLERHRVGRVVASDIRLREVFSSYGLLLWGGQGNVAKGWFRSVEMLPATATALPVCTMPDGGFDVIVAANVLERVANPQDMLVNLVRLVSQEGLIFLSYQSPMTRQRTDDWGRMDPKRDSAFRVFGMDFETQYAKSVPEAIVFRIQAADPATQDEDIVYVLTKNPFWMRRILQTNLNARILD